MTIKIKLSERLVPFETLNGKVFTSVTNDDESIKFMGDDIEFTLMHQQDCCESVYIESIVGDLEDLVGYEILVAEESSNGDDTDGGIELWTFYKLATVKGRVDIRFYGSSNGYYSVGVSLISSVQVNIDELLLGEDCTRVWSVSNGTYNRLISKPYEYDRATGGYLSVVDGKVVFSYTRPN